MTVEDTVFCIERQSAYYDNPWKVLYATSNYETAMGILKALDKTCIVKGYYVLGWYQDGELKKRLCLEDLLDEGDRG